MNKGLAAGIASRFFRQLAGFAKPFAFFCYFETAQSAFFETALVLRSFVETDLAGLKDFSAFDDALVETAQQ